MFISPELQNQVSFLCREIWSDEWSGMLFYETEGQFGDESFKVITRGLFLLDIGTQTYTEYDPADAELIKFLSANPSFLAMKKGHIHSHNNMDVFFSTTDDEELVDNCGFHNFYLSLIVNNKNEMCAKIAFKARTVSENNIIMTFLDQEGKEKSKKFTGKKEEEAIYVYKCEIHKHTEVVEDSFKSRFQEVREAKAKKLSETAILREKALKPHVNFDERWRQAGLFDDFKGSGGHSTPGSARQETVGKSSSVVERASHMRNDPRVHSMLTKLVSLDSLYEGSLGKILEKTNANLYPGEEDYLTVDYTETHLYYDAVEKRVVDCYVDSFPEDFNLLGFDSAMEQAISLLELYENEYPELVVNLIECLNLEIK